VQPQGRYCNIRRGAGFRTGKHEGELADKRSTLILSVVMLLVFGWGFVERIPRPHNGLNIAAMAASLIACAYAIRRIYRVMRTPDA
jgi:hypothetical protein